MSFCSSRGIREEVEVLARQYAKGSAEQQRAQAIVETLTISLLVFTSGSPATSRQLSHRVRYKSNFVIANAFQPCIW